MTSQGNPAQKVQSAGMEYGFPHGHLGRLTESEIKQFDAFKQLLEEKGLYTPGLCPSHDDPTLLRYLRARKWIVNDAYHQFKDTEEWREANDIDVLYKTIDIEAYDMARRLYPQWTGRRDKRGIPVYLFEIRHLDSKAVHAYQKAADNTFSKAHWDGKTPKGLLRLFALYENLTRFSQPLSSQLKDREHEDVPITLSTNIVDVSGVSLKMFWNLKGHMQAASLLATAHYPETLDRIFIIGAPAFFSTVWGWIKRWFDPVTVSKIFILGHHEVLPVLSKFIDTKNIPKKYGGELDFGWGDLPKLDQVANDAIQWCDEFKEFPTGPLLWKDLGDGNLECLAMGSENKVERNQRVCTIKKTCPSHPMPEPAQKPKDKAKADAVAEKKPAPESMNLEGEIEGLKLSDSGSEDQSTKELNEKVAAEQMSSQTPQAVVA